jgi:hypothetical protein
MNESEHLAKKWLIEKKKYKETDIIFRPNKSPDFICQDGNRYEVKYLYGNNLLFSEKQTKSLQDDDIILVFDKKEHRAEFKWKDRKNTMFTFKYNCQKDITSIQLNKSTIEKLKKIRLVKRESYNDVICRLIKNYEKDNRGEFKLPS